MLPFILKEYYPDPESALEAVRRGQAWGTLYFTENFTDALFARMTLGKEADDETLDSSEIRVWLDMSSKLRRNQYLSSIEKYLGCARLLQFKLNLFCTNSSIYIIPDQQIGLMLARNLQYAYRDFAQSLLKVCEQNTKLADVPIQFLQPIYGTNEPSFTDFVAPGVILT